MLNRQVFGRAFLAVLLCLCSVLFPASCPAEAENTGDAPAAWEERLEAARAKYSAETVNVYRRWHGRYRRGKINVCFYPVSKKTPDSINIRGSLQITDEAEIQAVLEVVAQSPEYSEDVYGTVSFMKAEWIAHNLVHSLATGSKEQQSLVASFTGERLSKVVRRAKELDISPLESMSEQEIMIYQLIEYIYSPEP